MNENRVMEIFEEIVKIPHCSGKTEALREWLVEFARRCGYRAETDAAGNVAAYAPRETRVTLQAHYDMVCIGSAPEIRPVVENGWMRAEGSSLGADNGIGVAIALWMLEERRPVDVLLTNDEEIGLIGANALELPIRTPYLLNLDSEELGKVYIGCAGGEDLYARRTFSREAAPSEGHWFRVTAHAPGGHSGVNIADGIPNAITELCAWLYGLEGVRLASLQGGERINAIPRRAEAVVWSEAASLPAPPDGMEVHKIQTPDDATLYAEGDRLVRGLFGFAHGVRAWNRELSLPQASVNLARVEALNDEVEVALSGRAMDNGDLERLTAQNAACWEALGFACRKEGKYPAWRPDAGPFAQRVLERYRKFVPDAGFAAIHAGLECAIFADTHPELQIASIGPTILDPHSDRERVELASVETVSRLVAELVEDLSSL